MNRFLIYTSNLDVMPKTVNDVEKFAKSKRKFYIANVELSKTLRDVKAGDNVFTKKGNSLYILRVLENSLDNLTADEANYVDDLTRNYGLKRMNITSVAKIVKFETWCKSATTLLTSGCGTETGKTNKTMGNSIKNISARLKDMYSFNEVNDVRCTLNGDVCVNTKNGWVAQTAEGLVSYPDEYVIEGIPAFVTSKPAAQLAEGDIIVVDGGYAKVKSYDAEAKKIKAVSYTGSGKTVYTVKDILFNQTMVRVVVTFNSQFFNNAGGGMNPLALALLNKKGGDDSILPLLLAGGMNGGAAAGGINPLMLAFLNKKGGDDSLSDILMMSAMAGGQNPLAGLFGGTPVAPAAPAANQ